MKQKNALRKHYIALWDSKNPDTIPAEPTEWVHLAKNIKSIEDDSEEEKDDAAFYDGDGSINPILIGRSERWNISDGLWDSSDPAMKIIGDMKRLTNDDQRKLWHRIDETNGIKVAGVAKALDIIAGSGEASAYEEFSCHIDYTATPQEIEVGADGKVTIKSTAPTPTKK